MGRFCSKRWGRGNFAVIAFTLGLVWQSTVYAARPLADCHSYLNTFVRSFQLPYRGHYHHANFSWPKFQLHLKELLLKYPDRFHFDIVGRDDGFDIYKISTTGAHDDPKKIRLVVTAGVHGEEPLGVSAALDLLTAYASDSTLRSKVELVMYPALNPWGLANFSRVNRRGQNFYGGWRSERGYEVPRMLMRDLQGQRFDLALDLHGAWPFTKHYLIRTGPDGGLSERAMATIPLAERLPSFTGKYPGRNAARGSYLMVAPGISEADYGYGTIQYFLNSIADAGYTPEYPGVPNPEQAHGYNTRLVRALIDEVYRAIRE